jgi:hypothetical protein
MARIGPLRFRTLEGSPITIGDATLVPQALLITCGRRQGWVTREGLGARGWTCGLLIPRALIEQRGDQSRRPPSVRRIAIPDPTGQALLGMAVAGLAVALFGILVQVLVPSPRAAA